MIIKKKQLLIDAPCIIGKKERQSNDSNNAFDPATVARILEEAKAKADEILRQAEAEAFKLLNEAKEKRQKMIQEMELERQQFKKHLGELSQRLNILMSNFQKQLEKEREEIFKELIDVLRILIEKIAFKSLDEVDFRQKMNRIFAKLSEVKNAKVILSEKDAESFPEILKQCEEMGFEVVRSSSLKPGEVLVDTELGVLDGTRKAAVMLVEKLIEEVFGPVGTSEVSQTVQRETQQH
uniref:Flagellar assembly protein FliH/Type III secretion system HrpE domain-containing protein n=1 Tax=Pseudothermotoga hypogea TaxID=57487 RepID=A0A832MNE9_9THEM